MVVNVDKFIDEFEAASLGGALAVGPISRATEFVLPISGVTEPTIGALAGSSIETSDYPNAVETGVQFEFHVPEDFDSGTLDLTIVYAMSTAVASPNNVVVLEVGAEIAKVSDGSIDTATYALSSIAVTTPDNLTTVTRSPVLLSISDADFAAGDKVLFFVKRLGADGSDLHTGDLQIIDFPVGYQGQIASRSFMMDAQVFTDTDEPPPPAGTLSSFQTLDFVTAIDQEQQFQFSVPDHWDAVSDIQLQLTYAMTTAGGGVIRLATEVEVANVTTGTVIIGGIEPTNVLTTADTDVHRTSIVRSISAAIISVGSTVLVKLARRGTAGEDTHAGNFQLISATLFIGVGSSVAVSELSEIYLNAKDIRSVSPSGVSGFLESADFAGDFEHYTFLSSTIASGRINAEWAGRLGTAQANIISVAIPIRGTGAAEYQIKIYVEGSGASPVFDSGLTPAPVTRSLVSVVESQLSAQPTGERRYFIVVEATLDGGEELRVGNPFARQG